jgi:hypothetical protein
VDDCDFDKTCPDGYDELVSRIAEYKARLDREKACFTTLIGEPQSPTDRVTAATTEIAALQGPLDGKAAATPATPPAAADATP